MKNEGPTSWCRLLCGLKGRKISQLQLLFGYLYDARLFHSSYPRNTDLSVLQHRIRVVIFARFPDKRNDQTNRNYTLFIVTLSTIVCYHLLLFVFTNCLYVIQPCNRILSRNVQESYLPILYIVVSSFLLKFI